MTKRKENRKGFTLIELLIVITIIGILAVAFLPTLLGAPARGRDTQRVADLQKIQKVLIDGDLTGTPYPSSDGCISSANFGGYSAELGGTVPQDPTPGSTTYGATTCLDSFYYYNEAPSADYSFGLYTKVENAEAGNTMCADALTGTLNDSTTDNDCYAILVQ